MADKKAFLLRVDPGIWAAIERLAQAELRSVNAQIEFLLRDALERRGIAPKRRPPKAKPGRGNAENGKTGTDPNFPNGRLGSVPCDFRPARARGMR